MRRRVLTALLAMTTLAVVAFFIPAALAIRSAQQRGELLELQREASIIATHLTSLGVQDPGELDPVLRSDHDLGLYTADGQLVAGVGPTTPDRIVSLALSGNFAEGYIDGDLVAAVPVAATAAHPALVVRIEASRSESRGRFLGSIALLAGIGVLIIAAAGVVGVWLSRRLNRPIEQLTAWAATDPQNGTPPDPTGIDELDGLRTALVDDRARIDELLARERSFSSQVSHQLRTPVAAMRVAIETELESPRPEPATVLHESLGQIDRLESTITSLLALARHTQRTPTVCDLLDVARRHAAHWAEQAQRDTRSLTVAGRSVVVDIDVEAIGHVLDILIDNALRHGAGPVVVSIDEVEGSATIDVSDAGPTPVGIDPFAEVGSDSSHGIGLRLARTLAESSHARLSLLAGPTTTFRLTLPR